MHPTKQWLAIGLAALAASAMAAPPARTDAGPAQAVEGPVWRLTEVRGLDPSLLPTGPQSVTASFAHGRVSGFSGCNRYFGAYQVKQGRIVVDHLAGSMMACEPPAMKVEDAFRRALSGSLRPSVAGGQLTLTGAGDAPALRFSAEPTAKLEGLHSTVTTFNNGRQATISPIAGTTITLDFEAGVVHGFAGCNTLRGTYTVQGDRIRIGPVATTRRYCSDEGVMQQEREFIAALSSTTTWAFSGAFLDMHRKDGERTLMGTRDNG